MVIFIGIVLLYSYRFILVLIKMNQKIVLPKTAEELAVIRKYPQKTANPPIYSENKAGIIVYALMIIYVIGMFILGNLYLDFLWTLYLLILLPMFHLSNLFNMFAVLEDGIICGARFVSWEKIQAYDFVRIDVNHNYYGFDNEVNNQYELKLKLRFQTLSCIVTSEDMKERLKKILGKQIRAELAVRDVVSKQES